MVVVNNNGHYYFHKDLEPLYFMKRVKELQKAPGESENFSSKLHQKRQNLQQYVHKTYFSAKGKCQLCTKPDVSTWFC